MDQTICILGRQPAIGLAELESVFGADIINSLSVGAALLNIEPKQVDINRLGGTIKVCELFDVADGTVFKQIQQIIKDNILKYINPAVGSKIKLGLSLYGFNATPKEINAAALDIKKHLKRLGWSARVIPNNSPTLNTAQVSHNQLLKSNGIELVIVKNNDKTYIAKTVSVQDIAAYAARDQARPKRDSRVGMLPPKLAQILLNLAVGPVEKQEARSKKQEATLPTQQKSYGLNAVQGRIEARSEPYQEYGEQATEFVTQRFAESVSGVASFAGQQAGVTQLTVLDPFCGTGVILQEALLLGLKTIGTDIEPRMVEYSNANLEWLQNTYQLPTTNYQLSVGDATNYQWDHFDVISSETYLGRPFTTSPDRKTLTDTINDCNTITKKFLGNVAKQTKAGFRMCLAVPSWRIEGNFKHLPLLDSLTDMGYTRLSFVHARDEDLIYHREGQIVARELLVLERK